MKKIGIIPLRKNSKGIPGKNKKKMVGRPLFTWVLSEAIFSNLDEIYVFTDDEEIIAFIAREYHWTTKVKTMLRSEESATDTASTEQAMLEFSEKINHDFAIICLLQATSPYTESSDINAVLDQIVSQQKDSALTVVKTHRFTWNSDGTPQNYDFNKRPRRQDFKGLLVENGAVYASTKAAFLQSSNRLSGQVGLVEMHENSYTEIDSPTDWILVENILMERQKRRKENHKITYLVLDVDGVFTDGAVWYSKDGELAKQFDMRDGMGLEILRQNAVEVMVLTSENSPLVAQRMKKLQIEATFLGVKDKYSFLRQVLATKNSSFGAVAYVGDDVNDLTNMCTVGLSFAPANATTTVKQHADFVLGSASAAGAIREVCETIIKFNKRYE